MPEDGQSSSLANGQGLDEGAEPVVKKYVILGKVVA
jgi:hypothetical protein